VLGRYKNRNFGHLSLTLFFLASPSALPLNPPMAHIVDRAINRIGPVFIVIALALLAMCVSCYYLVIFPYNHQWFEAGIFGKIYIATMLGWSMYMVYCTFFHYYMAIITPPGNVLDRAPSDPRLRHPAEEREPSYAESLNQVLTVGEKAPHCTL
jgi:hypothetical protein